MLVSIFLSLVLNLFNFQNSMPAETVEAQTVDFSVPVNMEDSSLGIKTTASNVIVIDAENRQTLYAKDAFEKRTIASITKLMTALVFLDNNPGWDKSVQMLDDDEVGGARLKLTSQESLTVQDLFNASLVASTNNGIMALVRSTGLTQEEFVVLMNQKAKKLGMQSTNFVEPTGMNSQNISTAYDLTFLVEEAFKSQDIVTAVKSPAYVFETLEGRVVKVYNTDILLDGFLNSGEYEIVGAKTGFLHESGYCLASQIRKGDREIISIVLNSRTIEDRFKDTKGLAYWAFNIKE